jgi:hypothetical protein
MIFKVIKGFFNNFIMAMGAKLSANQCGVVRDLRKFETLIEIIPFLFNLCRL